MTVESLVDPIEKEDKCTVFIPDASPKRTIAKKREGETHEEFIASQEYLDRLAGFVLFACAKSRQR